MSAHAREFLRSAAEKSADLANRQNVRRAIEHYNTSVKEGRSRFLDWEAARERCHEIKWEAINHLDKYLLEFEQRVKERGGHVFWAETAEDARRYVAELAQRHGVRSIVKSKSMVTEEIHLTPALEKAGIKVLETDLGEFIVQLRNEPPSHIVMPAMHLSRKQIAELFREKLGTGGTDDPPELVAAARSALRKAFFSSEMGITGANFLVADTGMIAITTNEGNDRLGTALPRIHVAVTGIEKVIPRLADLALFWPVLATAGTGQRISCYNTLIGGPRTAGEVDGPEEFHVVLLDNGRTELLADAEQRDVLHCIRCGSCLNACPVFRTIGGHAYGTTYSGPIGSVLTPHTRGLDEFQHLSFASSLCGACTSVCPVKIDLHHHLLHNRRNAVNAGDRPWAERMSFKVWRWAMMGSGRFAVAGRLGRAAMRMLYAAGAESTWLDPLRPWTRRRAAPAIPKQSFRALWKDSSREKKLQGRGAD
ncbi:MAG TPA: LutB/LldF family L-lactate oxidation iron-sulfur protein [Candidatus Limnocylindrales bacterium]|nr:LutB/LldF family L-lactate oxidation iron-sulfur protein [Candidatus Limnocylindrales bacterium]